MHVYRKDSVFEKLMSAAKQMYPHIPEKTTFRKVVFLVISHQRKSALLRMCDFPPSEKSVLWKRIISTFEKVTVLKGDVFLMSTSDDCPLSWPEAEWTFGCLFGRFACSIFQRSATGLCWQWFRSDYAVVRWCMHAWCSDSCPVHACKRFPGIPFRKYMNSQCLRCGKHHSV